MKPVVAPWTLATSPRRYPAALTPWLVPVAALLALLCSLLTPLNQTLWDALNRSLPGPPDPRVVVVGIDKAALQTYGPPETWDARLYASLLETLDMAGARAVAFDLTLPGSNQRTLTALDRPNVILTRLSGDPQSRPASFPVWNHASAGLSALNIDGDGVVRTFQRSYRLKDGTLVPGLSELLARAGGLDTPPSTTRRTLRHLESDRNALPVLSVQELLSGTVRGSSLRGRLVLVGLVTGGPSASALDISRAVVPQVIFQARALSSLLSAPFWNFAPWMVVLLGLLSAVGAVVWRGLWGFVIAIATAAASVPLWLANVQFPGATVSLCAIMGLLLVAGERWWQLRHLGTVDPLTGLGNRLAFTRAVEHRWTSRDERPIGLLLVDLSGLRGVNEQLGPQAGDTLLRHLAHTLRGSKRRADVVFRWGPDEFLILVDGRSPQELPRFAERLQRSLAELGGADTGVRASIGYAMTDAQMRRPTELIERASRMRYRNKYRAE